MISALLPTFQYMQCFSERNRAKYRRAKCNELAAYTVLGKQNGAIGD